MPGSIAALTMAWNRRMGGIAGPLSASGEANNGEPVQVELLVNGVWVDITAYVMVRDDSGNISITYGGRDEGSTAEQATCALLLDNRDGRFSPRNPVGTYYGLIGRNQPVRVSVPDGMGGKSYRFWGEVAVWPQGWDPTGTDVWTDVSASGIMRRLAQGPAPERSVLYNGITDPQVSELKAYWPCEDAEDSTSIASALVNGSAMVFSGSPALAAFSRFGASDPVPTLTSASITGGVTRYSMTSVTQYQVRFLLHVSDNGIGDQDVICRIKVTPSVVGEVNYFDIQYNDPAGGLGAFGLPGTLTILPRNGDESDLGHSGTDSLTMDVRDRLLYVSVEVANNGTALSATLRVLDLDSDATDSATIGLVTTNVTLVQSIAMGPATLAAAVGAVDTAVGHITLQTTVTAITDLGRLVNPSGEAAGRRVQRFCDEEGIAFESIGDLDDTAAMGGQSRINPLSGMQECELADDGMLYETRDVLGIGYRTRSSLSNQDAQLTLSYSGFNLSEVPTPVEDDRYIQNQVTVTVGEISQTYTLDDGSVLSTALPPTGVGVYGTDLTLNLEDTAVTTLQDQAAWRVRLGTVDEARYPSISVNLAHSTFTSNPGLKQAVLGLRRGDRVVVQNPPAWLPPDDIEQIILGFEETITRFEHRLTFVCAPASPYRVGILNNDSFRLDTAGSELLSAVTSTGTSLTVIPSAGQSVLWTTDTAEAPWYIRASGEVMTVTACTSAAKDTFTRSVSDDWSTADVGGAWTNAGGSATDFDVTGTAGTHTMTSVNVSRRSTLTSTAVDFDIYVDVATSALATGASQSGGPLARVTDANNLYMVRVEFTTAAAVIVDIRKRVASTDSSIASVTTSLTHVANTFYRVRFQGSGSTLRAKAWVVGTTEPGAWDVTTTDTSFSGAGDVGVRSLLFTGNTNVNPTVSFDNFELVNPQTFTVTRSTNGVVKAQVAGEDVRLAYPSTLSL